MNLQRSTWDDARQSFTWNEWHTGVHLTPQQIGRSPRWIPAFVTDDFQFRSVLVQAVVQYVFRGRNVPQTVSNDLGYLRALAADGFTRHCFGRAWDDSYFTVMIGHIEAVKKCGGILQMLAAIMTRAWKFHWHDKEIAEELGISPHAVAKQTKKLVRVARKLGYPTFSRPPVPHRPGSAKANAVKRTLKWRQKHQTEELAKGREYAKRKRREKGKKPRVFATPETAKEMLRARRAREAEKRFLKTVAWG